MSKTTALSLLALLLAACASPSPSAPHKVLAEGGWRVMVANQDKPGMLCYAGASPTTSEGSAHARESKPFLMATRRPSGKIEISVSAGYPFKRGSKVELAVDDDDYTLFYKDTVAWARGDDDDKDIIDAMESADDIQVRALSQAGLTSVDHYPPQGFALAIARIRELCP